MNYKTMYEKVKQQRDELIDQLVFSSYHHLGPTKHKELITEKLEEELNEVCKGETSKEPKKVDGRSSRD